MKKILLLFFFNSVCSVAFSQNPLVKMWDRRYGGFNDETFSSVIETSDGGFVLAGYSSSTIGFDKTELRYGPPGDFDFWIVKIDFNGSKLWDRDFGGIDIDGLSSIQETADHGLIIGGSSYSAISGNKTSINWGNEDYWIIKTDSLGVKQWDKSFGGVGNDALTTVLQTNDGGFLLIGTSESGISGNKTVPGFGYFDYWIVKTDSLGNLLWDKSFGGTLSDYGCSVLQTSDQGFLLGGFSYSGISGNKTQPTIGGSGDMDYWIIRIDSIGNIEWDKDYGGPDYDYLNSIEYSTNGGFIIGGWTYSMLGGDKTQALWGGLGDTDFWILKIDSVGNILWDKDVGGSNFEEDYGEVIQTYDGTYIMAGDSYSNISGNKTQNNLAQEQTWLIKMDSTGNIIWDKTIFTPCHDEGGTVIQASDGCYIVANYSAWGCTSGGERTQASWVNSADYWIAKYCDSTLLQPIISFSAEDSLCSGTCVDFTNLSRFATSYQWTFPGGTPDTSTSASPLNICYPNAGSYDVQLIASNLNSSDTLLLTNYITVFPSPTPQSIQQNEDTLFAIQGATAYQWYQNGVIIPGATNYYYVATSGGTFNVVATDQNGCEVEAVINDVIASIQYTVDSRQLRIYPNPANDKFTIQKLQGTSGTATEISIYNVLGDKMAVTPLSLGEGLGGEAELTVDCKNFPSGIYFVEMTAAGKFFRTKFVKE